MNSKVYMAVENLTDTDYEQKKGLSNAGFKLYGRI